MPKLPELLGGLGSRVEGVLDLNRGFSDLRALRKTWTKVPESLLMTLILSVVILPPL